MQVQRRECHVAQVDGRTGVNVNDEAGEQQTRKHQEQDTRMRGYADAQTMAREIKPRPF